MNSPVEATIDAAHTEGRAVLIGYLPAGYPSVDESVDAVLALARGGADIIELGVPYSDPVMDGVVIQRATNEALDNGFRVAHLFDILRRVTSQTQVPILVMTYWSPVFQYGVERFARNIAESGGAGLITPDLIPDEAHEWIEASDRYNLDRVFLAAPSSTDERLSAVVSSSRGFVYAVSTMGITGARADVDGAARTLVDRLHDAGARRVCVGVGISTPEHVRDVSSYAEGAIVGSHLVSTLAHNGVAAVEQCVTVLASGLR